VTDDLAQLLTSRINALPGVRGLFPDHPVSALARTLVVSRGERASALVDITTGSTATEVHVRVALNRTIPSARTLRSVHSLVAEYLPHPDVTTTVEIAYID
jgi:hypothetical protein